MTDWEDTMIGFAEKVLKQKDDSHSDIAQALIHLNRFWETGKLEDLRICNTLIKKRLDAFEKVPNCS